MCVLLAPSTPGRLIIADTAGICGVTPGTSSCLIEEELTIPVHWEGIPRLTEALAGLNPGLYASSPGLSPASSIPSQWPGWPAESPFLSQPSSKLKVGTLRESQGCLD